MKQMHEEKKKKGIEGLKQLEMAKGTKPSEWQKKIANDPLLYKDLKVNPPSWG